MSEERKQMWVVHWMQNGSGEYPKVVPAKADDLKYGLGRVTQREVIEQSLAHQRKQLERAKESVVRLERYVSQLERLLEKANDLDSCRPHS